MTDLTENNKSVPSSSVLDELNLMELYSVIYKGKKFVDYLTIALCLIATLFSLTLPNIYQSKSILSPTGEQNELSSSLGGLGGLATLTGINLPGSDGATIQIQALEKLKSLSFRIYKNDDNIVKLNNINGLRQRTKSLYFTNNMHSTTAILSSSFSLFIAVFE